MNIIVNPYGGGPCYCRPDTTWERENKDFYLPDCITELYWTPVAFAKISKAGKCIGKKFASRYYDACGYGILMYCKVEGSEDLVTCVDHTSILPVPAADAADGEYKVLIDGNTVFSANGAEAEQMDEAICNASALTSIRIGDYIAVELDCKTILGNRKTGNTEISGQHQDKQIFSTKVIF